MPEKRKIFLNIWKKLFLEEFFGFMMRESTELTYFRLPSKSGYFDISEDKQLCFAQQIHCLLHPEKGILARVSQEFLQLGREN